MTSDGWTNAEPELVRMVAPLDDFSRRLERIAIGAPEPGSRGATYGQTGFEGSTYAAQNLAMAVDHVRSWRWLLEARRIPLFAHMTLIRGPFEGAATAHWLLQADDSAERVRRAAIFGLEDLRNRRTFEALVEARAQADAAERGAALAPEDMGTTSGARRHDERLANMSAMGIGKADIPKYTNLMEEYGPGAHVYALTSAFAHRREWAMAFSDEVDRLDDTGMPGSGALQIGPSVHWALTMTESVMNELRAALELLEAHLGLTRNLGRDAGGIHDGRGA